MIRKLEIENFMSLKSASFELGPLSVFIGQNGSGKSALFKALVTLVRLGNGAPLRGPKGEFKVEAEVNFDDLVWAGNLGLPVRFRVWFDDDGDEPGYVVELRKGIEGWSVIREKMRVEGAPIILDEDHAFSFPVERGEPRQISAPLRGTLRYLVNPFINDSAARPSLEPILQFSKKFGQAWRYRPSASDIASFVQRPTEPGRSLYVTENGYGVAAELQSLQGSDRAVFEKIESAVCQLFPHIKAIGFKNSYRGVRLTFRTDRSVEMIPAPQESDGVLLATFLFWRLYTGTPWMKICLEEPENGLHPFLLADRFRALKRFAYREDGLPGIQLLIATHSPEFLRAIKAHPTALWKQIRLVEFDQAVGTQVRQIKDYQEAHKLIEKHLEEIHERWTGAVKSWI